MTMPHLMNCAHADAGWCLDCVKSLWEEKHPEREARYTVVVEMSADDAQQPRHPTMAYVLPTDRLSPTTLDEFRKAAKAGGCQVRMFTGLKDSGVEHVKYELTGYSATKVGG